MWSMDMIGFYIFGGILISCVDIFSFLIFLFSKLICHPVFLIGRMTCGDIICGSLEKSRSRACDILIFCNKCMKMGISLGVGSIHFSKRNRDVLRFRIYPHTHLYTPRVVNLPVPSVVYFRIDFFV